MRILAINDVSCIGKCSLTTALPIISACGVECNVLPTAILSTHTGGFQGYTFRDLTDDIDGILTHWKSLGIRFNYIVSGYLGSIAQIDLVSFIKQEFLAEHGKFIVDIFTNRLTEEPKADSSIPEEMQSMLMTHCPWNTAKSVVFTAVSEFPS